MLLPERARPALGAAARSRAAAEAIRRVLAVDELAESWYEALAYTARARGIAIGQSGAAAL